MENITSANYQAMLKSFEEIATAMGEDAELQAKARLLAERIEQYENDHIHFPTPNTLPEMIRWKMFEMKIKQSELAKILGIEASRISEILNGKRKVSIDLAKKLHTELGIDGNFILEAA